MANRHLKRYPHHIRGEKDMWWYEEPEGIVIVRRNPSLSSRPSHPNLPLRTIPWYVIRRALERKDAK